MKVKETINHINKYIQNAGYCFEKGCVENLYLSLRSKPFAVLTGPEGCGKYSLVRLFCESIGVNCENGRFKFVSVDDNCTKEKLFGCKNSHGIFVPGEITKFIHKALMNSEKPYFIYLDDMNMSNPDCYLSPILKAIDTRKMADDLSLASEPMIPFDYFEDASEYSHLTYPENLYIVGSISKDTSYFHPTMKIIDRANIIELGTGDIGMIYPKSKKTLKPICADNDFLKPKYLSAFDSESEEFMKITSCILRDINKSLKFIDKEIGFRTRDEILFYLLLNKEFDLLNENEAFDNVLKQRVLTRVGGAEAYVKTILGIIFKLCIPRGVGDYCANSLKMYRALSYPDCKYPKSAEKITFMTRRHEEHGTCSFFYV